MDLIKSCHILVQNNQFIFKVNHQKPFVIWFGTFNAAEYRPYYSYLDHILKQPQSTLEGLRRSLMGNEANLLMPDDALQMDFRRVKEFFSEIMHCPKVTASFQSLYLSKDQKKYIAFTKTCRCIVVKYIKDGKVIEDSFLPLSTAMDEIKWQIRELHSDLRKGEVPILMIDNQMEFGEMRELGSLVESSEIFENYEYVRNKQKDNWN